VYPRSFFRIFYLYWIERRLTFYSRPISKLKNEFNKKNHRQYGSYDPYMFIDRLGNDDMQYSECFL